MKLQKAFLIIVGFVFVISLGSMLSGENQVAQVSASEGPSIQSFTLINADTNQEIGTLSNGQVIDPGLNISIKANTIPAQVGSVRFGLDSNPNYRIENVAPYSLCADSNSGANFFECLLEPGTHTITATAFTQSRARGTAGAPMTVTFSIGQSSGPVENTSNAVDTHNTNTTQQNTGSPAVNAVNNNAQVDSHQNTTPSTHTTNGMAITSFTLVNADTNQDIRVLQNGETIDISSTPNISIRANTSGSPGSVRFWVNQEIERTENLIPFAIGADGEGGANYYPWDYPTGQVTITAIPSELSRFRGEQGTPLSVIVNIGGEEGGSATFNRDADVPENIIGNGVQAIAPDPSASYIPGQQGVPFTCDIGTDPGFSVWKLVFSSYQIAGGSTNVYTFATYEGVEYTTGQYTEIVTIPEELQSGAYTFHCVAYFYNANTNSYSVPGLSPAEDGLEIQIGTHSEPTGETSTLSISAPATNSNVVVGQPFTFSVQGSPTNDEIQSVDFYLHPGFGGLTADPVFLGSDSTTPFSLQATVSERYYRCPQIYAVANLSDGTQIKTNASGFHPVTITNSPTNNPWQCTPQSIGGTTSDFKITEPAWAAASDPGYNAGEPFTISAESNVVGANMDYVHFYTADTFDGLTGWDFTLVSTDTAAPYTTQATISTPADYGHPYFTNHVRAIAYYSNGQVEPRYTPIKINPSTNLPEIQNVQVVNTQGQTLMNLSGGEVIDIGDSNGLGQLISLQVNTLNTESVSFNLSKPDSSVYTWTENNEPFVMFGDTAPDNIAPWQDLQLGAYTLTVTPYSQNQLGGTVGQPLILQFVVENTDDLQAPNNPTSVNVTYRSANEIKIGWVNSTSTDVSHYKVYRNDTYTGVQVNHPTNTMTDTNGINGNTTYQYKVTAVDTSGNEAALPTSGVQTPSLNYTFSVNDEVEVSSQTAQVLNNPEGGVTGIQNSGATGVINNGPVWILGGNQYWQVDFDQSTLDGWVNEASLAPASAPQDTQSPSVPTGLSMSSSTQTSISIDWNDSVDQGIVQTPPVTYKVFRSTSQNGTYTQVGTSSQSQFTDNGLSSGTTYYYKVSSLDSANPPNESSQSGSFSASTQQSSGGQAPSVPSSLSWKAKSGTSTTLDWIASSGVVDYYEVEANNASNGGGALAYSSSVPGFYTSETAMNLTPNVAHSFRVRACNSNGCSGWTNYMNTTSPSAATPTVSSQNAVRATATVSGNTVTISWPESGNMTVSKKGLDQNSWTTLPGSYSGSFSESLPSGSTYEYRIANGTQAYGYVAVSNNELIEESNGHIVVVVAQNLWSNSQIDQALDNYEADLISDGWIPIRIQATSSADTTRDFIIAEYNNPNQDVKAVVLVGRTPIKSTSPICPDGHCSDGEGPRPFPADFYFGDMDGTWSASSEIPDDVELQVGRIDMSNLPQLGNEVSLTLNYFNKLRDFKSATFVPSQRGILLDSLTWTNAALTETGWRSITPLVGSDKNTFVQAITNSYNYISHVGDNSWLWGLIAGGGSDTSVGQGPVTSDYSTENMGVVFNIMFGSYFGEWDEQNNILRGALTYGAGLANVWAARPNYFFHRMGAGENIGESIRVSMNNTVGAVEYQTECGCEGWGGGQPGAHMGLMGDPTLRMNYIKGPSNLNVTSNGNQTQFAWSASPEPGIDGYNVYRVNRSNGTFTKLNGSIITGTSYNSSTPYNTGDEFIVRAQKTTTTTSGRYKNLSLGAYGVLSSGQVGNPPSTAFSQGDTVIVNDGTN